MAAGEMPEPPDDDGAESDAPRFDATDTKQVKSRDKLLKHNRRRAEEALKAVMSLPDGRIWMASLLYNCGLWFTVADANSARMNLAEGRRTVALDLQADVMRLCPDHYATMLKEHPPYG